MVVGPVEYECVAYIKLLDIDMYPPLQLNGQHAHLENDNQIQVSIVGRLKGQSLERESRISERCCRRLPFNALNLDAVAEKLIDTSVCRHSSPPDGGRTLFTVVFNTYPCCIQSESSIGERAGERSEPLLIPRIRNTLECRRSISFMQVVLVSTQPTPSHRLATCSVAYRRTTDVRARVAHL